MPTSDDYARATIQAGRDLGISPRGIQIGLATNLVEAGPIAGSPPGPILNYANAKVPESLKIPHDYVGSDGLSVGTFQQQVRRGTNGNWWWADAATSMDPYKAARLFFTRLKALDYNNTRKSPGSYAQTVQGSAYPLRYDEKFPQAVALYDRLTKTTTPTQEDTVAPDPQITDRPANGGNNGPRDHNAYIVIHTSEGKSDALGLHGYCVRAGVSYNFIHDDRRTVVCVPDNLAPWAAVEANEWGVHICASNSFAGWTRGKWMETDASDGLNEDAMLWRQARIVAAMSVKYGIPLRYAGDGGRSGWPVLPSGVVGHRDFGRRGGGHTDPGAGYPMDELLKRAQSFISPPVNLIDQAAAVAAGWIGKRLNAPGAAGETVLRAKGGVEIGRFVAYENGHVYWRTGERAAVAVPHGGLFEAWGDLGWETGPLGFPTRDFAKLPDGAVQAFQGGTLYRKDGQPGFYVTGIIGQRYLRENAERSDLGYPVSNERDNGTGGRVQAFEHGTMEFDPTGAVKVLTK